MLKQVQQAFAEQGALSKAIDGFKAREPQKLMAASVTKAIENGSGGGGGHRHW
jgi:ATP-dependent DNA helicase DinG